MNKNKGTISNILRVSISNIAKILSGVLIGFLLPLVLGVKDYGYYKTFTLYSSYVGLFSLGFVDGILLKYGGADYESLNKEVFRRHTRLFFASQLSMALIGCFISLVFIKGEGKIIFIGVSTYLFLANITGYYQVISQITFRFKELSFRNILYSILTSLSVLILFFFYRFLRITIAYQIYIFIF